ncbi:MAG: sigma-70 family RNA polymerase sigma factor [Candidatus Eisenbacteria bacterium]|nr:sigma-70 family RNA polymerase sigma factor [Candidatus Eisenbacteria bacterium]
MPERDPKEQRDPKEIDLEKVREAQAGDREAFDYLVERHKAIVYAVAYRFAKDPDLALDLSQNAFIRAYRGIKSFRGKSSFSTWLYRITMNTCIDYTRKRSRSVDSLAVPEEVAEYAGSEPIVASLPREPGANALSSELGEQIQKAIDLLPEYHRSVFVLYEIEGLAYKDIAEIVGCSIGTVMSRLHYARKKLRVMLAPYVQGGRSVSEGGAEDA